MKKLMTFALLAALVMAVSANTADAQENSRTKDNTPQAGSWALGLSYNPVSGKKANDMFKAGDFVGNAIAAQGGAPAQMVILAEPLISVRFKYRMNDVTAFRASVGFSGASFNYREYVRNDEAFMDDPLSVEQVEDNIRFGMKGGGINIGLEFGGGPGNLRFTGGFGLMYSFGGGSMKFAYGNAMSDDNRLPTTMPIIVDTLMGSGAYYDVNLAGARPLKRYNVGMIHAFGLTLDAGVEWFFIKNLSVGANISLIPLIYAIQPETYTEYEGFSAEDDTVLNFTKKVSPGSTYMLYGTENFGLVLSLSKYF